MSWKIIKLGTGIKDAPGFRKAIRGIGYEVAEYAYEILSDPAFQVSAVEKNIHLVAPRISGIGFENGAKLSDIYAKVQEMGLELCPPEVGPQLRLQYQDQPRGEWLNICMKAISSSKSGLSLFTVEHDGGGHWLHAMGAIPETFFEGKEQFVFCLPQK